MNEPFRILHINSLLNGGGTDDQCLKLVAALRALGHDARLLGPGGRKLSHTIQELGIPFHAVDREGPLKLKFIFAAARFIRRNRIQVIHGHHGRDIWPAVLAARLSRVRPRVVITRHMAKSPASWLTRRTLLGLCDSLLAVSEFTARVMREGVYEPDSPEAERRSRSPLIGDLRRIKVVHGGIDTDRFAPRDAAALRSEWGLGQEDYAFGVVGTYSQPRGKGQREFLAAAARIHEQAPQARFLIIGRGNLADTLRSDIERLGLKGRAWLTPYCDDMPAAMNALNCLVHPQVGTEAFGLVLIEAAACGRPVIASRLDGIPEAFEASGFGRLVTPESVAELSEAMLEQVRQPTPGTDARLALHQRIADRFSLPAFGRRMANVYGELLKPESAP